MSKFLEDRTHPYLLKKLLWRLFLSFIIIIIIEGFIISVIGDYTEPLSTGTKFLTCFSMPCFFLSLLFNNFTIYGMADLLYLSVHVSLTRNFSWYLFDIQCNFVFFGNIDLNLSVLKHFSANFRQRDSLLSPRDWSFNSLRASL